MIRLSRREREIADLVALGLTNREIGERLFISERTAEGHIQQIRNKLGFNSRTQIAAWSVEHKVVGPANALIQPPSVARPGIRRPQLSFPKLTQARWLAVALIGLVLVAGIFSAGLLLLRQPHAGPAAGPSIFTYAGMRDRGDGYSGDEGPATSAILGRPSGVIADGSGNRLYIAECCGHYAPRIRFIDAKGDIHTVTETFLGFTHVGLAVDPDGNLYVAKADSQITKVDRNFRAMAPADAITIVAGTGQPGYAGDGGPATSALLGRPSGLASDSVGNLYVADQDNHVVRMINREGVISTFAGTGTAGYGGDVGPANRALLNGPAGIASDAEGNVYIADRSAHRIRVVGRDGIINTVAGNGTVGFRGDGGAAREARLNFPTALAIAGNGDIYIADTANNAIRRVRGGVITTIAGQPPRRGSSGDGGPAASATLNEPAAVAVNPKGEIFVADTRNYRIRVIRPAP
jgi:DNA-binding CsgD family transcriptional regulator/sugar lactone lactonase YvrE